MTEVLERVADSDTLFLFWCPGCETHHHLETKPGAWKWDGDMVKPTVTPSLLVNVNDGAARCHFFITYGTFKFLGDSYHKLAGKTVAMSPVEQPAVHKSGRMKRIP